MPRPGNTPLLFFAPRYLMDLATRPGRGWLVQQLSGEWFGVPRPDCTTAAVFPNRSPCPGRGTPPPFLHPPSPG